MSKLGRKISCKFKSDVRCIMLVNGKKLCFFDETSDEQFYERHEMQFVFCPLFPEVEKVEFMTSLKEGGFNTLKRFSDDSIPDPYRGQLVR